MVHSSFCTIILVSSVLGAPPAGYHPVVVSGPLLGQSMEVSVDSPESPECNTDGFRPLWGQLDYVKSLHDLKEARCFIDSMGPAGFDRATGRTVAKPGVKWQPLGGFEADGLLSISDFFGTAVLDGPGQMLERLESEGYVRGDSYFGHSYDWRLAVGDWRATSFPFLRRTIETAFANAGHRPAVVTGVSMAGPYTHAFFTWMREQQPGWVERHVHAFMPVNAPFHGSAMALSTVLSGSVTDSFANTTGECPICDPKVAPAPMQDTIVDKFKEIFTEAVTDVLDDILVPIVHKFPSMYFMSPGVDHSTNPPTDPVLVSLEDGSQFHASELPELLRQVGRHDAADLMEYSQSAHTTSDPGVPVHCFVSENIQTWTSIAFPTLDEMDSSIVTLGDGDGTVEINSQEVCERWPSTVKVYRMPAVPHSQGLSPSQFLDVLLAVATNKESAWRTWQSPNMVDVNPQAAGDQLVIQPRSRNESASVLV